MHTLSTKVDWRNKKFNSIGLLPALWGHLFTYLLFIVLIVYKISTINCTYLVQVYCTYLVQVSAGAPSFSILSLANKSISSYSRALELCVLCVWAYIPTNWGVHTSQLVLTMNRLSSIVSVTSVALLHPNKYRLPLFHYSKSTTCFTLLLFLNLFTRA